MRRATWLLIFAALPLFARNDESCDISALPAATLLLPYFEVDVHSPVGLTTIFTITNVTQQPQVARVTLWTDRSYPVYTFNVFLTGYDVQSINLRDIIAIGRLAPRGAAELDPGDRSEENDANPFVDASSCVALPYNIAASILADVRGALTTGRTAGCGSLRVGNAHPTGAAIGYVTIDVVKNCNPTMPLDERYFTNDILYDNVLIGDYELIDPSNNFAEGGTMVHIRAIPEGGTLANTPSDLSHTFYGRYVHGNISDRRQPLPSRFVARWIENGVGAFETTFKIWRDRSTKAGQGCDVTANRDHASNFDVVRFDDDENPTVFTRFCPGVCAPYTHTIPSVARIQSRDASFVPPNVNSDLGGWIYFNLDDYEDVEDASQNWVVVSMRAEGRYSTDNHATALENGCSPHGPDLTGEDGEEPVIAPVQNNDDSCDIAQLPAATLLLPYFEVDLASRTSDDTLFTVTNVTPLPQIAHVTIWTDLAWPVLTFDMFLTGYDLQAISLYDVLKLGRVARPYETEPGRRSAPNDGNPLIDASTCAALPSVVPQAIVDEVRRALTTGFTNECGSRRVGETHARAIGYVTIDVAGACNAATPADAEYYTKHLRYDNVLVGDYQQVDWRNNYAQGGAMVHIRATAEGANLPRTFYSRYQSGAASDRRQPLPSAFAARWIDGGTGAFNTTLKIWRESDSTSARCDVTRDEYQNVYEFVRFDEEENPSVFTPDIIITVPPSRDPRLPAVSRLRTSSETFPPNHTSDIGGWMYLNLDNPESDVREPAAQNWVIVSMAAEGHFSVDFDAQALGNGCSPGAPITAEDGSEPTIGPPPN